MVVSVRRIALVEEQMEAVRTTSMHLCWCVVRRFVAGH